MNVFIVLHSFKIYISSSSNGELWRGQRGFTRQSDSEDLCDYLRKHLSVNSSIYNLLFVSVTSIWLYKLPLLKILAVLPWNIRIQSVLKLLLRLFSHVSLLHTLCVESLDRPQSSLFKKAKWDSLCYSWGSSSKRQKLWGVQLSSVTKPSYDYRLILPQIMS